MSYFFPLPQFCTVYANNPTTERSGQQSSNWTQVGVFKCLVYQTTGNRFNRDLVEYENIAELYMPPDATIKEGYRVTNITDSSGNVLDTGYYEVQFVRRVVDLAGHLNHYSAKIKGVSI